LDFFTLLTSRVPAAYDEPKLAETDTDVETEILESQSDESAADEPDTTEPVEFVTASYTANGHTYQYVEGDPRDPRLPDPQPAAWPVRRRGVRR
jgi:hypothetical protein